MNQIKAEIKDKIRILRKHGDHDQSLIQEDDQIHSVQSWLYSHPQNTIDEICTMQLSKYDILVVDLIKQIGSPIADKCAYKLIELLVDMNWPVYRSAVSTLFSLEGEAIIRAVEDLIYDERFRELDIFCCHAIQFRPDWLLKLKPHLTEAIEKLTLYTNDSYLSKLCKELEKS